MQVSYGWCFGLTRPDVVLATVGRCAGWSMPRA